MQELIVAVLVVGAAAHVIVSLLPPLTRLRMALWLRRRADVAGPARGLVVWASTRVARGRQACGGCSGSCSTTADAPEERRDQRSTSSIRSTSSAVRF